VKRNTITLLAATAFALLSAPMLAADIPARTEYRAPAMVATPAFTWTGCYVGANVGGAFARDKYVTNSAGIFVPGVSLGSHNSSGVMAGGQLGCNYQTGALVFGVEGMFDWINLNGSNLIPATLVSLTSKTSWLGTATGRVGYAFDRSLLYVKGGGAWINEKQGVTALGLTIDDGGHTRSGWTLGTGWEYAFAPNWSAKVEYNYMDFGNRGTTACLLGVCGATGISNKETIHSVLIGVNYRFSPF
jgi:outer membrane immunogenic protein